MVSLVGREREISDICALLKREDVHIVTVSGPGGVGKTLLTTHIAARMHSFFTDGLYVVSLASLQQPEQVLSVVAHALELKDSALRSHFEQLRHFLGTRRVLFVLDNLEQVLGVAPTLVDLLLSCPGLKMLITSRIRLNVRGEHEYRIRPLALPEMDTPLHAETLMSYSAIALFVQCVQRIRPDFELNESNAPVIVDICMRLDGLPLALELAAARTRLLSPEALRQRLEHRFMVLTGGRRDVPRRQQTLRDTIAWSYDLLSDEEQSVFRRLALFSGGCSIAAAETVSNLPAHGESTAFDILSSLLDKNLLYQAEQQEDAGEPRLYMLETIREFALEQLQAAGEFARCRKAHALYYLQHAQHIELLLAGPEQVMWLKRLDYDYENIRSALNYLLEQQRLEDVVSMIGALGWFWFHRGRLGECLFYLQQVLDIDDAPDMLDAQNVWDAVDVTEMAQRDTQLLSFPMRTKAILQAGLIAYYHFDQGFTLAEQWLEEGLVRARVLDDKRGIANALNYLTIIKRLNDDVDRATLYSEEALAIARTLGNQTLLANTLCLQATPALFRSEFSFFRLYSEESLAISRELKLPWLIAVNQHHLGWYAYNEGAYETAQHCTSEALKLFNDLGDPAFRNEVQVLFALEVFASGEEGLARELLEEELLVSKNRDNHNDIARTLYGLGHIALRTGRSEEAGLWFEEAIRLIETTHFPRVKCLLAACLEGLASLQDNVVWATRLLGAAEQQRLVSASFNSMCYDRERVHATEERALAQLGDELFASLKREGLAMSPVQVLTTKHQHPVLSRQEHIQTTTTPQIAEMARGEQLPAGGARLTQREREVLQFVTAGLDTPQIAGALGIRLTTLNSHLTSIYRKLGVTTRVGAMRYAIAHDLLAGEQ